MNKKGFTLMELLLVVAVLAIVAAASAPTFFGGAKESMEEALKTKMFAAYQNSMAGANLLMSIAASQGRLPKKTERVLDWTDINGKQHFLAEYAPLASRVFENNVGTKYTIYAIYNEPEQKCVAVIKKGIGDDGYNLPGMLTMAGQNAKTGGDARTCLNIIWEKIKEEK